jgi:hypothetical protein
MTNSFVGWMISVTPEVTITKDGLSVTQKQPILVKYPKVGPIYLIDTTKSLEQLAKDESGALVVVGREDIIVKNRGEKGELRIFSLKKVMEKIGTTKQPVVINKLMMKAIAARLRDMLTPVIVLVAFPFFFIWKLVAVLFYSVIGLVLNLFKKEKLAYGSLFTLCCFAITPVTIIEWMSISIPDLNFDLRFVLTFGLTIGYLAFGMFVAPRAHPKPQV